MKIKLVITVLLLTLVAFANTSFAKKLTKEQKADVLKFATACIQTECKTAVEKAKAKRKKKLLFKGKKPSFSKCVSQGLKLAKQLIEKERVIKSGVGAKLIGNRCVVVALKKVTLKPLKKVENKGIVRPRR